MRALSIIAVVFLLMGCAKSFVLATGDETSAIDFSKSMKVGMSSKLDKLIVPILRGRTEEKDGYKIYESTFFPVEGGSGGLLKAGHHIVKVLVELTLLVVGVRMNQKNYCFFLKYGLQEITARRHLNMEFR